MKYLPSFLALLLALTFSAFAQDKAKEAPAEPAAEKADDANGWVSMFNGENLDHWKSNDEKPDCFVITDDGEILVKDGRAHLFYVGPDGDASFKNFEFRAKVKNMPGSNSGLYFHTEFQAKGWPDKGYEAQVNITHKDRKKTGGLYGIADVLDDAPAKDEEWYDYYIKVDGQRIIVKINGEVSTDYTEPEDAERKGGFAGRLLDEGTFCIQGHDPRSKVYFKDLHVKALP